MVFELYPMGDLTKNLSRAEFSCKCEHAHCKRTPVDYELPVVIQDCADHFAHEERRRHPMFDRVAVHINSGHRCPEHNREVGGAEQSTHVLGMAADHWMEFIYRDGTRKKIPDDDIADYYEVRYPDQYGIGRYKGRTHIDVRNNGPARWDKR